jgi:UMF1 family MFS transporter
VAASTAANPLADVSAKPAAGRLAQLAWALCDGSRVPYNVLVNIFVFSAYYTSTVITDGVEGQARWSFITAAGAIIVALTAPLLGAIADAGGRRKPWLAATYVVGVPAMMLLWFATPGMTSGLVFISIAIILGNLFYEYSQIFANAMLPNVAPPQRIGFLSGAGLAVGNLSGIILFCFFLFAWSWNPSPLFGLDPAQHEPERAVGILAGIWALLFCLPLFFVTPDSPGTSRTARQAISHGMRNLADTIRKIRNYRAYSRSAFSSGRPPCSSCRGSQTAWPQPSRAFSRAGWIPASARRAPPFSSSRGVCSRTW